MDVSAWTISSRRPRQKYSRVAPGLSSASGITATVLRLASVAVRDRLSEGASSRSRKTGAYPPFGRSTINSSLWPSSR